MSRRGALQTTIDDIEINPDMSRLNAQVPTALLDEFNRQLERCVGSTRYPPARTMVISVALHWLVSRGVQTLFLEPTDGNGPRATFRRWLRDQQIERELQEVASALGEDGD